MNLHNAIHEGVIPCPGDTQADHHKSKRERELEHLESQRDEYRARAHEAEKKLATISLLVAIYWRQDEPEGQVSARRTLTAISETFATECSICRRRHGAEVQHACE